MKKRFKNKQEQTSSIRPREILIKKHRGSPIAKTVLLIGMMLSSQGCTSVIERSTNRFTLKNPEIFDEIIFDKIEPEEIVPVVVSEKIIEELPIEEVIEDSKPALEPVLEATTPVKPPSKPTPTPVPTSVPTPEATHVVPTPIPLKESQAVADEVSQVSEPTHELEVLRLVNAQRENVGVKPLTYFEALEVGAGVRALEIIELWSHTRPDGTRFSTAFKSIPFARIGENLASGFKTPEAVVDGWMSSESHRLNLLNEDFEQMAIATSNNADGRLFWVQILFRAK